MAQVTKISFSHAEMNVLVQRELFFLKNSAIDKVYKIFGELQQKLQSDISSYPFLGSHTETSTGKIFRGENYRQLPYVVLDYPKRFSADSIFTFRSMFWWGNEFSFTLHLHGHSLDHFRENIRKNIKTLKGMEFFFCVNSRQWDYTFEESNYLPLDKILNNSDSPDDKIASREFIKLSRKLSIEDYEKAEEYGSETFRLLMKILV